MFKNSNGRAAITFIGNMKLPQDELFPFWTQFKEQLDILWETCLFISDRLRMVSILSSNSVSAKYEATASS